MTINLSEKYGATKKKLPNASKYKNQPTRNQINEYQKNKEEILDPIVIKSLKRHPADVLHGSQSLHMIIPGSRKPNDWDLYSFQEEKRALALEQSIDNKMKSDFAYTEECKIPRPPGKEPKTSKIAHNATKLYVVKVRGITVPQIDVMDMPKGLPTFFFKGITHESLESQHYKLDFIANNNIAKMTKAIGDRNSIEDYLKSKGKKLPERTHGMTQKKISKRM
jgi:hypothetical protein